MLLFDTPLQSLLSLDDMVLHEILNHMIVKDLVNLGRTCKRLGYLTQLQFEKHYSSVTWKKNIRAMKLCESTIIFRNIGRHIRKIRLAIWSDLDLMQILVTLGNQCSHLSSLTLDSVRMSITTPADPALISMFSKLRELVLNECTWTVQCPLQIFFGENSTLEELSLIDCCEYNPNLCKLQLKEFRALKELRLENCGILLTTAELQRCFENNNISVLSLTDYDCNILFEFEPINSLCSSLESITFTYHSGLSCYQVSRLKNLKKCRVLCLSPVDVHDLLENVHQEIEELEFANVCITTEMMEYFKFFKKLRHLSFERCSNFIKAELFSVLPTVLPNLEYLVYSYGVIKDRDIVHMFRLMPYLKYLNLFGCNALAVDTYTELVDILIKDSHRPKLKFIPPQLGSLKCLENFDNLRKVRNRLLV